MPITGYNVGSPNYILRFCLIVFLGVISVSSVLFWRSQLLFASEYQELPVTQAQLKIKKENVKLQKTITSKVLKNQVVD